MIPPDRGRSAAPEAWLPARRVVERVLVPIERFLRIEAASGLVLLATAIVALVWANSPFADSYARLWHAPVTLGVGAHTSTNTLHFWVNDGLMVIFFFVVGLEIRREIHQGQLSEIRRAALPAVAALGGMVVPALVFSSFNTGLGTQRGWAVPMATDIAFAVGVLSLLGKRVPPALRVLLLTLAIIDDIGAIIVIALFYSSGISFAGLALGLAGVLGVWILQRLGVRRAVVYVFPGFVLWLGCLRAGIHPTIAGVILGLMTPARAWFDERVLGPLDSVRVAPREAGAPVVRLQTILHPWVAFVIMPLFALANAGVRFRGLDLGSVEVQPVMLGVVLGLVVGKPIGIVAFSFFAVRLRLASRPAGVSWRGLAVIGAVAGIGFTMAIFIAELAFAGSPVALGAAKLGVLVASATAGVVAVLAGRILLREGADPRAAPTVSEAEASTDT